MSPARWALALLAASACSMAENYPDPAGPRFAGDRRRGAATPGPRLRVVTYNVAFCEALDSALELRAEAGLERPFVLGGGARRVTGHGGLQVRWALPGP